MDVLYEDERIIVVDKPHFLATMRAACGIAKPR